MHKKLQLNLNPLLRILLVFSLVISLALCNADTALAARSAGRMGGGSFRMPSSTSRTYAPPNGGGHSPYGGSYGYGGGGFGLPFLLPLWGFGGGFGGLFTILIFFAIASSLVQAWRRGNGDGEEVSYSSNPNVSVVRLQVGLLAQARDLQPELNRIAETADTNTPEGRAEILQETSLALLRHPEYFVYAGSSTEKCKLDAAESKFNRLSLAERSKFSAETLTNVNNQLKSAAPQPVLTNTNGEINGEIGNPTQLISEGAGRYLVVTLLAATLGQLEIPALNNPNDLSQALRQIGSISSEHLLAIEVLWTPQAEGDTLTSDDLFAEYPDLRLV